MHAAAFLMVTALVAAGAGASNLKVNTEASVNATQGETVTLTCSIGENVTVQSFQWTDGWTVFCNLNNRKSEVPDNFQCNYTHNKALVLTIKPAQPDNTGKYICKVFAESGHGSNTTKLHVSEETIVISKSRHDTRQDPNQACISESKWINLLGSLTMLLVLILYSGR